MSERLGCPFCHRTFGSRNWITRHINTDHPELATVPSDGEEKSKPAGKPSKANSNMRFKRKSPASKPNAGTQPGLSTSQQKDSHVPDTEIPSFKIRRPNEALRSPKAQTREENQTRMLRVPPTHWRIDSVEKLDPKDKSMNKNNTLANDEELQPNGKKSSENGEEEAISQSADEVYPWNAQAVTPQELEIVEKQSTSAEFQVGTASAMERNRTPCSSLHSSGEKSIDGLIHPRQKETNPKPTTTHNTSEEISCKAAQAEAPIPQASAKMKVLREARMTTSSVQDIVEEELAIIVQENEPGMHATVQNRVSKGTESIVQTLPGTGDGDTTTEAETRTLAQHLNEKVSADKGIEPSQPWKNLTNFLQDYT